MTTVQTATDFGTQSEDMDAINQYMRTKKIINNAAFPIKDDFIRWWDNLGFYDKNFSQDIYDEARTRRNKFDLANVKNEADRAEIQRVITTGQTTEQMQGKKRPPVLSTGEVGASTKKKTSSTGGTLTTSNRSMIKQGSKGDDVVAWQQILGVKADGNFGPGTYQATIAWQKAHGLKADGIVGPDTWRIAEPPKPASTDSAFAPSPSMPSKPVLQRGSRGADVSQWQGIVGIKPPTGFFGDLTVARTKELQKLNGIPQTGIVDAKTWAAGMKGQTMFAPTASPASFATPAPKPAQKPAAPANVAQAPAREESKPKKVAKAATKKVQQAMQASTFDFTKWPTWVQFVAGGTAVAGIVYGIFTGTHQTARRH